MVRPNSATTSRWLKRLRRELSGSGLVAQCASQLAREDGVAADQWARKLRDILAGTRQPEPNLILRLENLIARPRTDHRDSGQTEFAI